jgi:Flp pilus assembly protein TadG
MNVEHEVKGPVEAAEPSEPKPPTRGGRLVGRMRRDEGGFVLVWTALFLMVLLGFAALAVDLGHSYYVGQQAQDAADAAALAGAPYLPGDLAGAQAAATQVAASNGFASGSDVTIDAQQDPGNPAELVVTIHQHVPTFFGGAIGFNATDVSKTATGIANQAATNTPTDMVLILDRTGSMSASDLQNVKDASNALLGSLDPTVDDVALGVLGPSDTTAACANGAYGNKGSGGSATWIASPWPNIAPVTDYQAGGALNANSQIVKTINCLTTSSVGTDLGDPVAAAQAYLAKWGRPGAQQDIILMTDGSANQPNSTSCQYANNDATTAKNAGLTIVTIGFGIGHAPCEDTSGPYAGDPSANPAVPPANATTLLANMASAINGVPAQDNNDCSTQTGIDAENADGDNFFCVPKGQDLANIFVRAAQQLVAGQPRLVH